MLVVERWVLAHLRKITFFSLGQLNDATSELLVQLNDRAFKKLPGSQRSLFEQIEKSRLLPLPAQRDEYQHVRNGEIR